MKPQFKITLKNNLYKIAKRTLFGWKKTAVLPLFSDCIKFFDSYLDTLDTYKYIEYFKQYSENGDFLQYEVRIYK